MKRWSRFVLIVLAGLLISGHAHANGYPDQPIIGYIAWGAGGGTDTISRMVSPISEKILGQSIVMVNKTGNTGVFAAEKVFNAKADGHTLLFHAENPQLYQVLGLSDLSYDEFDPIMLFTQGATVLVVPQRSPIKSYADLITAAKQKPGEVSIGLSGVGGQPWVTSKLIKKVEGVDFKPVSFNGDGPLITALLGGRISVSGLAVSAAIPYIKSGDLRPLAIMKNSPNKTFPDVPHITKINPAYTEIMKASGFFYGVYVKKGTPESVKQTLVKAFEAALNDESVKNYTRDNGLTIMGYSGAQAREFIDNWRSIMSWLIWDSGAGKNSPAKFGIPKS